MPVPLRRIRSIRLRRVWGWIDNLLFGLLLPTAFSSLHDRFQSTSVYHGLRHVSRLDHGSEATTEHRTEYVLWAIEARAGLPYIEKDVILPNAGLHVYLKRFGPLRRFQLGSSVLEGLSGGLESPPRITRPVPPCSGRTCGDHARSRIRDRVRSRRCAGSS